MSDPIALRAITAVATRLAAATGSSPYHFNLTNKIFLGLPTVQESEVPCAVIHAISETMTTADGAVMAGQLSHGKTSLEIAVEIYVAATEANFMTQVERAKADVKRALFDYARPALSDAGGQIGPLAYLGSELIERDPGQSWCGVRINARAIYTESFGDPTKART